jgi:sugar phosphate isomerase/epimerase
MADVGKGVIDFGALLAAARTRGLRYAFVERDDTQDPIATIRVSHDYLTTLLASR